MAFYRVTWNNYVLNILVSDILHLFVWKLQSEWCLIFLWTLLQRIMNYEYTYIANMFLQIMDVSLSLITTQCGCKVAYTIDIVHTIKNIFLYFFKIFTVLKNMWNESLKSYTLVWFSVVTNTDKVDMSFVWSRIYKGLIWTKFKLLLHILA